MWHSLIACAFLYLTCTYSSFFHWCAHLFGYSFLRWPLTECANRCIIAQCRYGLVWTERLEGWTGGVRCRCTATRALTFVPIDLHALSVDFLYCAVLVVVVCDRHSAATASHTSNGLSCDSISLPRRLGWAFES